MPVRLAAQQRPSWAPRRQKIIGRWAIPTAAEPQRPGIRLNRYPHEIIGVCVVFWPGARRYLSWVWPARIVGVPLTKEQFDLEARELLDQGEAS